GDYWEVSDGKSSVMVKHTKGMHYLAILLQNPGMSRSCLELSKLVEGPQPPVRQPGAKRRNKHQQEVPEGLSVGGLGGVGEPVDEQALKEYKRSLPDLEEKLAAAKQAGFTDKAADLEDSIKMVKAQIASGTHWGTHPRDDKSQIERARRAVCGALER